MSDARLEALGFAPARLARVREILEAEVAAGRLDGAAVQVRRRGEIALEAYVGAADADRGAPLTSENTFCSLSMGKQFINVLVLNRVERGDLRLTTQVREIVPEFARRGKDQITVGHILTHTSGLSAMGPTLPPEQFGDLDAAVAWACDSVLESRPGERVHYSALVGHVVLAELLRRTDASGRGLHEILQEDLFGPLGMRRTSLGGRPDLMATLARPRFRGATEGAFSRVGIEALPLLLNERFVMPGGGYVTHLEDVGRFADMLRGGGALDGVRLLSPSMIRFAARNWTGEDTGLFRTSRVLRGWDPFPAAIGLGFFTRGRGIHPTLFGSLASEHAFGGAGTGTTAFWVDPARDLGFVFLSHSAVEDSEHIDRVQRLSDVVHASIVDAEGSVWDPTT